MFDLIIKGGQVIDGTGCNPQRLDVGIDGGKIQSIAPCITEESRSVLNAQDMYVSPGFIDVHSHCDLVPFMLGNIRHSRILQGVTTELVGQCGLGPVPYFPEMYEWKQYLKAILGDISDDWQWPSFINYLDALKNAPKANNVAFLVTHGAIRAHILGLKNIQPNSEEVKKMQAVVRSSMENGALGISYGLAYIPGLFAMKDELVALSQIVAEYDGIMMIHIRNHSHQIKQAVQESLRIARDSGVKLQISHMRSYANRDFGISGRELIQIVEDARARGADVTFDEHLSTAGSTLLSQVLPPWAKEGGGPAIVKRMQNSDVLNQLRVDLSPQGPDYQGWDNEVGIVGWSNILISSVEKEKNKQYQGKTMDIIAAEMGVDVIHALSRLLVEENAECCMVMLNMFSEQDIIDLINHPLSQIGSDGIPTGTPHPRLFNTFPKLLGHYVRDLKIMDFAKAIKKITGDPALRLNIKDRGFIKTGQAADIVVFDPARIAVQEDYIHPDQIPSGIKYVLVNGKLVVNAGNVLIENAGKVVTT